MKIVHLTDSMEMGGAEKLIMLLCRLQRLQGHEASVHCLYRLGALGEALRAEGFEVAVHARGTVRKMFGLYKAFCEVPPDVVHIHNATAAILGAWPARLAGVKSIVCTRHGLVAPPHNLARELKFAIASRACNAIVAVCKQAQHNLIAAPFAARSRVACIYNAAKELPNWEATAPARSGFTLLHVGRLSAAKDQQTLLRAFALLCAENAREWRLWIVGDGALRASLELLTRELRIASQVTFFGEQSDVARHYHAADLFVMSSITEGVPIALLEALSAGLPAVVTDVGGMSEIAKLTEAVWTVPPDDPERLAAAIREMARNEEHLPQLRDAARECFASHFRAARMADEYMQLYRNRRAMGCETCD